MNQWLIAFCVFVGVTAIVNLALIFSTGKIKLHLLWVSRCRKTKMIDGKPEKIDEPEHAEDDLEQTETESGKKKWFIRHRYLTVLIVAISIILIMLLIKITVY